VAAAQPVLDVPDVRRDLPAAVLRHLCFVDNFCRRDHHGLAKAGWTVLILVVPFIGALIYVIARPADAQLAT
jgi:Phospholipase_D-nuclease N-terminal